MLTPTPQNPSLPYVYSWRSCLLETRPWWTDRMNLLLNRIENTHYSKLLTRKSTDLHVSEGSHIHIDGWFEHNTKPVNQVKINNMLYKQNLLTSDKLICNVTVRDPRTLIFFTVEVYRCLLHVMVISSRSRDISSRRTAGESVLFFREAGIQGILD